MKFNHDIMHCYNTLCKNNEECERYLAYKEWLANGGEGVVDSLIIHKETDKKECLFYREYKKG